MQGRQTSKSPPRRRPSSAARAGPLDRRLIAKTALALIDRDGLDELSMRRLGAELGVEAMALYHHFRNKAELLDGVLELLIEASGKGDRPKAAPLKRLRHLFENIRRQAIDHPRAFILVPTRRFRTKAALDYYEWMLGIFAEAGFSAEASARYFRVLVGFVTGAGLAEIGSRAMQSDATPILLEDFNDEDAYPHVSALVPHLRVAKLDRIFDFGLDLIFSAMAEELARAARAT